MRVSRPYPQKIKVTIKQIERVQATDLLVWGPQSKIQDQNPQKNHKKAAQKKVNSFKFRP